MGKLTDDPVLLAHFLLVVVPNGPQSPAPSAIEPAANPKRHRLTSYSSTSETAEPSKYTFQPDRQRVRVHRLTTPPSLAGTSPVDFVDGLISHSALQFAPYPGTLMRLFDLQFGTRGLSIMHLAWLNSIQKMEWIMSSGVNMQNFSLAVALPPAATPRSLKDVSMALSSFHTYCVAFCTDDVVAIAQELFTFVQQLLGHDTWAVDDLPHLVFWLNSRLERFRAKVVHDLSGGNTRRTVCASISTTDPEYQAIVQQLTQRALTLLRPNGPTTPATVTTAQQTPKAGSGRSIKHERRQYEQPRHTAFQSAFAAIQQHISRRDNRELCLRYLSTKGCPGAPGDPSQCDQRNRIHDIPATLLPDLRTYLQRFGGLRSDLQHL
ncbi:uncharacterized protein KRP23_1966 [Phytophthora ramorum]|uniref:uncharacterized protein n=1 Tax=Phytophthora ramorum TaxID=164328 RepID=UPI0030A6D046|nr:hypothetical protein KRP23_1966 [Phytophthora ramorum]